MHSNCSCEKREAVFIFFVISVTTNDNHHHSCSTYHIRLNYYMTVEDEFTYNCPV